MKLKGIVTALATPFFQGELDKKSFIRLVKSQLDHGVDGLVIGGTTGEAPVLEEKETARLMNWAYGEAGGKIPLVLGIGHNNTRQAVKNIKKAYSLKASAVLAVVPYYNRPSSEGLYQHFKKLSQDSPLPIYLYNVPSRTGAALDIPTLEKLAKAPAIQGIKDASGDMKFAKKLFSLPLKKNFTVTSGCDDSFLKLAEMGGRGVVSVASHFLLRPMKQYLKKALKKDSSAFVNFQKNYGPIVDLLFQTSNPMMIKQVLYLKNMIRSPELRLPLCPPPKDQINKMKKLLKNKNL